MRLINTFTLELKEFFNNVPPYAILSHTWGDEEVTFQEYLAAAGLYSNRDAYIKRKAGFRKIIGACERAQSDGLQYLWCDTNCIDKSSSAELSEAINSMYAWYRDSVVCYVYLADVDADMPVQVEPGDSASPVPFEKSRWFTRGWTLQELLAPKKVVFFDYMWKVLGDRKDLADVISRITRIHIGALHDQSTVPEYSVAQRMSWAADRRTSRLEDIAYCLLGIFGVSMPLLYGEGQRAFQRLQHAIINITDDQSILVWTPQNSSVHCWTSVLALHPAAFKLSGSVVRDMGNRRLPYSVTNLGISMSLPCIRTRDTNTVLVGLNCSRELRKQLPTQAEVRGDIPKRYFQIWILLKHMGHRTYMRGHCPEIFLGRSYPLLVHSTVTSLLLVINVPDSFTTMRNEASAVSSVGLFISTIPELLITLASGSMMPEGRALKEGYLLDNVIITRLSNHCRSPVSHYIISSGSLSIILSIHWDQSSRPKEWLHTTVPGCGMQKASQSNYQKEWKTLIDNQDATLPQDTNMTLALHSLHSHLKQIFRDKMKSYQQRESHPLIWIRSTDMEDLHGDSVLIVEIIFREPPRTIT
ncbi:HET-domain-containing protein [Xylaria curta]|nr:HET-domain-containing protein [Xylaria curta]